MTQEPPVLVIVGRVNRGKSSILSTLAEDDSVVVSPEPGATTEVHRFPLRVDGETLFQMVDTPGFEDAACALRFLQERDETTTNRREVVETFVRHFEGGEAFAQECKLLRPILDGGAILYVVDGSHPYRRAYEAEMEILRWTGQPRIALINRTGERDYAEEWRAALGQYFSIVRTFDAHHAGFRERLGLFEGLRELDERWRPAFDRAIEALNQDWARRRREAAQAISAMIINALLHTRHLVVEEGEVVASRKKEIEEAFHDDLRKLEEENRREIERLYLHRALVRRESSLSRPVLDEDLFSKQTWKMLGLSLQQLIGIGVVAGAGTGLVVEGAGTGVFLPGAATLTGALVGGAAALYFGASRFERAGDFLRYIKGGRELVVGPHQNPNFAWILLDRALLHYVTVRDRAHGKRDPLELSFGDKGDQKRGFATQLPDDKKRAIAAVFSALRKRRGGKQRYELRQKLAKEIEPLLENLGLEKPDR
ncbi:MAG TPA: GTPase/DUF3482 domain-containing protein [Opitutales bacterium]|nr:GTPase/DUF3482 domain-containing protein [Opitutales bacterium]